MHHKMQVIHQPFGKKKKKKRKDFVINERQLGINSYYKGKLQN